MQQNIIQSEIANNILQFQTQLNKKFHSIPSVSFFANAATKLASNTNTQAFCLNSELVFRTSQNVQIHQKPKVVDFRNSNTFLLFSEKKKVKIENRY